mmetsp:Transcript_95388/g.269710  ORF Transcript_95388/g.269710 Transcript_95388/m.269710 type:complete len:205 (-) Transcript_95388:112-726(-)
MVRLHFQGVRVYDVCFVPFDEIHASRHHGVGFGRGCNMNTIPGFPVLYGEGSGCRPCELESPAFDRLGGLLWEQLEMVQQLVHHKLSQLAGNTGTEAGMHDDVVDVARSRGPRFDALEGHGQPASAGVRSQSRHDVDVDRHFLPTLSAYHLRLQGQLLVDTGSFQRLWRLGVCLPKAPPPASPPFEHDALAIIWKMTFPKALPA